MHFKYLLKISCLITSCFFAVPAMAQNANVKTTDTIAKTNHVTQPKRVGTDSMVTTSDPAVVTTHTENPFNQGAIFNPLDQLTGKMAGVNITEPGGDPNQIASVSIRGRASLFGNSSPLFVVDGVIMDDVSQFQNIPPDEITSYTVLKDASAAAIYGVRGANGVIIVTTRKGVAGKIHISYDGLVGAGMQSKYYDLLSAGQFRAAVGPNGLSFVDKGANTDWQKAIGRTAIQQRNSLSVSGGSNIFTFLGAVDYQNQQGIIQNNGKDQLGLRFNAELKAFADKLDVKAGIQYVNTTRKFTDYNNFGYVPNAPPTYPVKNPDGSYYAFSDFDEVNPVEFINGEMLGDKEYLTLVNGSADYSIIHDLKIGVLASADLNNLKSSGFIPSFPILGNQSQSSQSNEQTHAYDADIHISYDKTFGKNTLNLLGAYEYTDHSYDFNYQSGVGNNPGFNSGGFVKDQYKLMSFIASATYNYDDIFYAAATLRKDALANNHDYFPSLSLAYRFKKDLLADADWISDIKLRAGYGVTGNAAALDGSLMPKWEKMHGLDIGLDFSLFNSRISGDVNYFNNQTRNLLLPYAVPSPPFSFNTLLANAGSLTNKGLELAVSGKIISGHKLSWTAYGQITFVKTTVGDLSGQYVFNGQTIPLSASQEPLGYAEGRGLSSNPIDFLKAGYGPYVFYLPHYTGVNAQGNQMFDGQTIQQNPNPKSYYIDPSPKFNYGITNSFDYGNWNLNFALRGVYGQKIFDNTLLNIENINRLPGNNVTREALTNGIKDAPVASDKWLENASFLRVDNASLGYSFKNVSFASVLRVFVAANNLFVITGYKGLDPEVKTWSSASNNNVLFGKNFNGSQNQAYIDGNYSGQGYYPMVRTFSLGVNVTLK